jgi:hypothetical protein
MAKIGFFYSKKCLFPQKKIWLLFDLSASRLSADDCKDPDKLNGVLAADDSKLYSPNRGTSTNHSVKADFFRV